MVVPDLSPVLFNMIKHHRGYLHQLVRETPSTITPTELRQLLFPIGAAQFDFYTGPLATNEIVTEVKDFLQQRELLEIKSYFTWIEKQEGYRLVSLTDSSEWVLRLGRQPGKWVHLHPARYSPHTLRIKAPTLKTALSLAIKFPVQGADATGNLALVNEVRGYLKLPPLSHRQLLEGSLKEISQLLL